MKNLIYLLIIIPFFISCQKYNTSPFDDNEKGIRELPENFDRMSIDSLWDRRDSLTYLRFENIKLVFMDVDSIPSWIGEYQNLTYLSTTINKKKFKTIPKSIGKLKKLETLKLLNGDISIVPNEMYSLYRLKSLNLQNNNIDGISKNIGNMISLKSINLRNNPLTFIPEEICRLSNLKTILLENTKIKDLPKCLENLQNLEWINVSGTQITYFPIEILNAKKLETIHAKRLNLSNYQEVKAICKDKNITLYYDE